ncbi:lipase family alpha/beta hydrolase [Nocardioides sp.]|uniref:lipase family alpha/beta hydrolase n=1 Tax=Nocardioides sp. TaxID=35761 RepID=UPI003784B7A1
MLDGLSPARRRFVGAIVVLALVLAVVGAAAYLLSRPDPVQPVAQDAAGPVLLVPGYGGSTTGLDVLAAGLRDDGRDVTVVQLAGDGTGDLRTQAKVLDEAAHQALERTGAESVDVVGYSAGGIVARVWVADLGGASIARRVVTLSSPNHGTQLATLASGLGSTTCPAACQQLATGSDLLRALNDGDETPAGPRWVAMWTADDATVVPPESGVLDGATSFSVQSVCPGLEVGHTDVPQDPTVLAMVADQLDRETPGAPDGSVCAAVSP